MKKTGKRLICMLLVCCLLTTGMAGFSASAEASNEGLSTAQQIAAEGIVLLKNENSALPLAKGSKLSVFGSTQIDPFLGGGGSGSIDAEYPVSFLPALKNEGFRLNQALINTYQKWWDDGGKDADYHPSAGGGGALGDYTTASVAHAEMPLTNEVLTAAKEFSNTAVIIIGRSGSEGTDLRPDDVSLYPAEVEMVRQVAGTFDNVVVLFNICNVLEMSFLNDYPSIKAAAIIWSPGETGMVSVADMLSGDVNPSGKLADTIAYNVEDHPSTVNFGSFVKPGSEPKLDKYYIQYEEDIYVGYRYFETFDVDVQYPFGYGLSYTTFDKKVTGFRYDADQVIVTVQVENTGKVAGKEVVELYYGAPQGELENPAKQLIAFGKTDTLDPGAQQILTLKFNIDEMASYSEARAGYLMQAGDYKIYLGGSVHDADQIGVYAQAADKLITKDKDTDADIKNRFPDIQNGITLLSQSDPTGTWPTAPEVGTATVESSGWGPTGFNAQTTGNTGGRFTVEGALPAIADNTLQMSDGQTAAPIQLIDVYHDPSKMSAFVAQLTDEELVEMQVNSGFKTMGVARLGIPTTNSQDGPACVKAVRKSGDTNGTAFPIGTMLACTWNQDLAHAMGVAAAAEAKSLNIHSWYAPGANTHRSPLGGRNFEYFSEDPILGGIMLAGETIGAQENGLTTFVKHFAGNDIEINRLGVETNVSERAYREIYTKQFEYAIKAGSMGIMSAFNRLGETWCGASDALLNGLAREEWGFQGVVLSDAWVGGYMNAVTAVENGNDTMLGFSDNSPQALADFSKEFEENPTKVRAALEAAAAHICQYVMTTYAFSDVLGSTQNIGTNVDPSVLPYTVDKETPATLTFETNDGTKIDTITGGIGTVVELSTITPPTKDGYTFGGWYADEALTKPITSVTLGGDTTQIYAKWDPVPELHAAFVEGYSDGTIRPDASISRAEVATLFYRQMSAEEVAKYASAKNTFHDVSSNSWYAQAVTTLTAAGYITGYPGGTFRPDDPITRAEFTAIAVRFKDLSVEDSGVFNDTASHWASSYIAAASKGGLVNGYSDGSFHPNSAITRAESITMIDRSTIHTPDEAFIDAHASSLKTFSDLSKTHWAYYNIVEATNAHMVDPTAATETWTALVP